MAAAGAARLRPLDPGALGVQEQIDLFAGAEVVVAPHGAALANLVFCPPGVRVLELFHPRYVNPCYWAIADNPGADYRYLVCGRDGRPAGSPMHGVLSDILAPPAAFTRALDEVHVMGSVDQLGMGAEPVDGAPQAVLDLDNRLPAEGLPGQADVRAADRRGRRSAAR